MIGLSGPSDSLFIFLPVCTSHLLTFPFNPFRPQSLLYKCNEGEPLCLTKVSKCRNTNHPNNPPAFLITVQGEEIMFIIISTKKNLVFFLAEGVPFGSSTTLIQACSIRWIATFHFSKMCCQQLDGFLSLTFSSSTSIRLQKYLQTDFPVSHSCTSCLTPISKCMLKHQTNLLIISSTVIVSLSPL